MSKKAKAKSKKAEDRLVKVFEKAIDTAEKERKEKEAWSHPGANGVGKRSYYVG